MISKSIATSEQVASVSLIADYLFTRMIPHLDSEGRMPGSPRTVKGIVCPLREDITAAQIETALAELHKVGLIVWYAVEGKQYVEFPKFRDHQRGARFAREGVSRLPASSREDAVMVPDHSGSTPGVLPLSEVKRSEEKVAPVAPLSSPAIEPDDALPEAPAVARAPRSKGAKVKPAVVSWTAEGSGWWVANVGDMNPGRFGKSLTAVVQVFGWPPVFADLQKWVAEQKDGGRAVVLNWYADKASARLTASPPPMYDYERMELTPYGERMTRPERVA